MDIIKQLDGVTFDLCDHDLSMGTKVLCMACPLTMPYLSVKVDNLALILFRVTAET